MKPCEDFLAHLERILPETCSDKDLIAFGLYNSPQASYSSRKSKKSPSYFKLGGRIMYTKKAVMEWIRNAAHEYEA